MAKKTRQNQALGHDLQLWCNNVTHTSWKETNRLFVRTQTYPYEWCQQQIYITLYSSNTCHDVQCHPTPVCNHHACLQVVDSAVLRFSSAVTHFSPGSYTSRPLQRTSYGNVFMAGDWVKGLDHGANGLSQERAYITGLAAANLVIGGLSHGAPADIIPVEADEQHVSAAKGANQAVQGFLEALPLPFPRL